MSGADDEPPAPSTELPLTDLSATPGTGDARDPLLAAIAKAPVSAPPRDFEPGTIVGHGFRIERRLGAGGMGVVYLARDMTLARDVALKVHRAVGGLDRLQREAVAMARLAHPNVITVHEIGRVGDRLFVAMEYVAGQTLRDWFTQAPRTWREIVAMMRQVGLGLCAAHAAGLVHRDFKPENVLVGPDGRPRVGDFGLVRVVGGAPSLTTSELELEVARTPGLADTEIVSDGDASTADTIEQPPSSAPPPRVPTPPSRARRGPDSATLVPAEISTEEPDPDRLTATGAVLGTPAYMAPEQFAGERVDARADQFAFCVVLYEGLYGQRPFAGKDHGQILRAIEAGAIRPPPPGRRAPRWLRRVIERGLSVEPAQRFPSLHALLDALDRGARRRNRWVAGGVLAAALAIAAVAVVAGPRRAPEDTCGGAGAEFDAVWSSTARGRLATSAASADVALGPKVAARVTGRLDELRASYREAAHRACVARELDHTWDDDLYHRSRLCLEGSLAAARDLLARPLTDRHTLGELVSIAVQLPSPERCARPTTLAASPFFGHGLVTGAGRVAVYDALDLVMGSHEPIAARKARVEALARAAELLDTPVLDARVELVRASLAYQDADFAAAQAGAERAFHAARASGDDPDAAQAATLLLRILGVEQTRFEAARPWLLEALAEADRKNGGGDAYLAAAAMSARQGQLDDAVAYAKKAVAQLEDVGETRSEAYAFALDQLASVLDEGGHSAEAVPIYRRAIALDTELAGADGPPLFQDETNLSLALAAIGDDRGAIASARHAVALAEQWQGVLPADSLGAAFLNLGVAYQNANQPVPAMIALEASNAAYAALPGDARDSLVIVLADLALVHKALGRYPEAAAEIQQALALYKDLGLEGSTDAAQAELTLGQILSDAGQCKDAIPVLREATASLRAHVPTGTGWVIGVSSLGPCLRDTGHAAEALAAADEAATALAGFPHPKHIEAEIRWQIAQALHAVGRDPARARAQAAEARALWVADDAGAYAREIGAVDDAVARWPR